MLISANYNSSNKNNNFTSLGFFELEMRDGLQLFNIDYNILDDERIKNKIKAIKLVIKNSFGGNKTYINQIMFYENTIQEIKAYDTIQSNKSIKSNNTFHKEMNLPEDLSNSQISLGENSQQINNENNININNNIKKIRNTKVKKENIIINGNKMKKKHNIIDFISESNSKISERNILKKNKEKEEDIKVEENNNNNIYNGNTSKNNNEEEYIENNNNNEEDNKIISTSEGFQNSYMDIKSTSQKNEDQYLYSNNTNENDKRKIDNLNYNNKKVQKLEKILKQKILKNEGYKNYNTNQNRTQEYNMNNFPNFTPILKNNNNNYNYNINRRNNFDNQSNISERESNYENAIENNSERNNQIQKYFQIHTPDNYNYNMNRFDYLLNKKRPTTPNINEIYINPNQNPKKLRNRTLQNFKKTNLNKTEITNDDNKAYETLEYQLNDMEQHLQKMALNSDMIIPNNNNIMSRTNREQNYLDKNIKQNNNNNNNSLMSNNTTSYLNEERNNINNINNINNNNYFTNYKINNESQYGNNTFYKNREWDESANINERIDNLEKNIFEIKNELNNISSGIKLFLDKDYFLYNFKDIIKQICFDFFSEKMDNNNDNNENINQTRNENNENEEGENSKYNNTEFNESKNNNNENNDITRTEKAIEMEDKINKKIDEKLEYLCNNLKNQIYQKYLQPSINEIENSMKQNMEDIKKKVELINYSNDNNTNIINGEEIISTTNNNEETSLDKRNKQRKKYEEINRLGEKLYDKLMEKEKKLKLLKQETTKLLNGKSMENDIYN